MLTRSSHRFGRRSSFSIKQRRRSCLSLDALESRTLLSLTFVSPPASVVTGQVMAPIKVQSSNQVAGIPITVSLSEQSTVGTPILGGTVTQPTDTSGTATFGDLYIYGGTGATAP